MWKKLDEWVRKNLVGRRVVLTGKIRDFVPVGGDVFAMGITVPISRGRYHYINCRFPASLAGRVSTMKVGDKIKISGTVETVYFLKDEFLAELIDGSF